MEPKMRRKDIIQYNDTNSMSFSKPVLWLCICCLSAVLLTSNMVFAANLDPTDILESYLIETEKNNKLLKNKPAAPKPVAIKITAKPTSSASFAAKDTAASDKSKSARITTPVSKKTSKDKSELKDLIDKLNAVKIQKTTSIHLGSKKTQTTKGQSKKRTASKKTNSKSSQNDPKKSQKESYESFTIDNSNFSKDNFDKIKRKGDLKDVTIKSIKDLMENPESFNSFFELGEILFESKRLEDAYIFYKLSLESTDEEDKENRPWIIFQLANCLRNTDYSKAIQFYKILIDEFPHCEWAEFSKNQIELLTWYLNDDPKGLIRKTKVMLE